MRLEVEALDGSRISAIGRLFELRMMAVVASTATSTSMSVRVSMAHL